MRAKPGTPYALTAIGKVAPCDNYALNMVGVAVLDVDERLLAQYREEIEDGRMAVLWMIGNREPTQSVFRIDEREPWRTRSTTTG